MEEEEQNEINKKNQFSNELNKTAIRMKELAKEYATIIDKKKNIDTIDLQTQDKIIQVALIMETFMEGQKLLISNLLGNKKD